MYLFMKSVICSKYIFVFFEYSKSMTAPSGVVGCPIVSSAASKVMAGRMRGKVALITLVNSAGVRPEKRDRAPAPAEWERVVDTNLTGTYYPSRAALPALSGAGQGAIVNLSSVYGVVGGSLSPAYAASKGAVVNLTRQMAMQWAPGVRVNCVCPGMIETPMTRALLDDPAFREAILLKYPLQRFGQPDEVASAILYLASDEAAFVTGVSLPVDGGYTAG